MRAIDNSERTEHQQADRGHDNEREPPAASPADSADHSGNLATLQAPASASPEQRMNLTGQFVCWPTDGSHESGQRGSGRRMSWPVGRVLCTRLRGPATIHLGLPLPTASSGLPASSGGPPSIARAGAAPLLPLDLAPGGVYRAAQVTLGAGGLLHHRFTLTPGLTGGGLLSVALSRGLPRVGVTDHPALRSPDLPRRAGQSQTRRGRPASSPAAAHQHTGQPAHGLACARGGQHRLRQHRPPPQRALGLLVSESGCPAGCRTRRCCATAAAR